jgi:hypothetical protein
VEQRLTVGMAGGVDVVGDTGGDGGSGGDDDCAGTPDHDVA